MTSRLTREMVAEARELLRLLGLPTVQAPSEGEAQAAHMARAGRVWAAASKDYDTLLFGAPRLLRFLTISGKEFLPSQGTFRPLMPELLTLDDELSRWGITREGLIDLALLVGTDFNDGVHGIGPKKALALVQRHGSIEAMPAEIRDAVGDVASSASSISQPDVTDDYAHRVGRAGSRRRHALSVRRAAVLARRASPMRWIAPSRRRGCSSGTSPHGSRLPAGRRQQGSHPLDGKGPHRAAVAGSVDCLQKRVVNRLLGCVHDGLEQAGHVIRRQHEPLLRAGRPCHAQCSDASRRRWHSRRCRSNTSSPCGRAHRWRERRVA